MLKKYILNEIRNILNEDDFKLTSSDIENIKKETDKEYERILNLKNEFEEKYEFSLTVYERFKELLGNKKYNNLHIEKLIKSEEEKIRMYKQNLDYYNSFKKEDVFNEVKKAYIARKKQEQAGEEVLNRPINKEDLVNLFVTALEGGSNYWYYIDLPEHVKASSEEIINYLLKGGSLKFYDVVEYEDILHDIHRGKYNLKGDIKDDNRINKDKEEALLGIVDMDSILDGISLIKRKYPELYKNILLDDCDADCADIFLQLIVMGSVEYG